MTAGTVPTVCEIAYKSPVRASPIMSKNLTYFKPTLSEIKFGKMRFFITDRPSEFALDNFVKELQRHRVKTVVRVCEPTYRTEHLKKFGIEVIDWEFVDGSPPPEEIIEKWLALVRDYFDFVPSPIVAQNSVVEANSAGAMPPTTNPVNTEKSIAIHCVSGLGRAPVLVAIALLEAGMRCDDVIFLIRTNRRGALNEKQLEFLKNYKPLGKLRKLRFAASMDSKERKSCSIM